MRKTAIIVLTEVIHLPKERTNMCVSKPKTNISTLILTFCKNGTAIMELFIPSFVDPVSGTKKQLGPGVLSSPREQVSKLSLLKYEAKIESDFP